MNKVRKWMMEILLEVTSQEMETVAKEVYYKARNQAAKGTFYVTVVRRIIAKPEKTCSICFMYSILVYRTG